MNKIVWPNGARCAVTFSIDDTYKETVANTVPIFRKNDIMATYNIIAGKTGKKFEERQLADWNIIKTLSQHGHEIASHGNSHYPLRMNLSGKMFRLMRGLYGSTDKIHFLLRSSQYFFPKTLFNKTISESSNKCIDLNTFEDEAITSKKIIEDKLKSECNSFCYPTGTYTKKAKGIIQTAGYSSARSCDIGFNGLKMDKYALKVQTWDKSTTAKDANKWIDEAKKNGYWLIECLHLVGKENLTDYEYFTNVAELDKHISYIKKNNCFLGNQRNIIDILDEVRK